MPGLVERWRHLAGRQTRHCVDIVRVLLCSRWHLSRRRTRVGRNGFIHGLRAGAAHHTHRFWTVVGEAEGRVAVLLQQQRAELSLQVFTGGRNNPGQCAALFSPTADRQTDCFARGGYLITIPLRMPSLRSTSVGLSARACVGSVSQSAPCPVSVSCSGAYHHRQYTAPLCLGVRGPACGTA